MISSVLFGLPKDVRAQAGFRRLRQRGFLPNVMVVMTSTGLAQLLTVCFSPVLSRLYGPGDFGLYGTFLSLAGVLSAAITLQYSEALMLPHKDEEAVGLFWAASLSALGISALAALVSILFPSICLSILKAPQLKGWLWLVPAAALVTGLNQTLTAWCARRKAFKRSAAAQVARSLTANSGQTAAGAMGFGAGGLIGGGLVGDLLANLGLFCWVIRSDGRLLWEGANRKRVQSAAQDHKDFALYSTPQNVLNAVSQGAPVILLIHYFGAAIGGLYAFAFRVLQLPMNFVLASLRQVLFQRLSEVQHHGGDLKGLFVETTTMLFALSLIPAGVGFILAPWLFGLVFGKEWIVAGEYARWLLIWLVPGFCNMPAVLAGRILRQQRNLLVFDTVLLISRIGVLMVGGLWLSPLQTIIGFSLVGAVFNAFLILFIWGRLQHWRFADQAVGSEVPPGVSSPEL
jgi:O-antigen/teichoic acid export membrane protein